MTQQLNILKSAANPKDALWWQPMFSLQRELNRSAREAFSNFSRPSFMAPSVWDAEEDIFSAFQRNTHRIFSELFNNRQMSTPWVTGTTTEPYVNIIENGNKFKVRADVPGLSAKDLEVSISDNAITISGTRCSEEKDEGDSYLRRECHFGAFSRTIALPEEADVEKASARFEQNVLTVEIPKKQEAKSKSRKLKIEAQSGAQSSKSEKKKQEAIEWSKTAGREVSSAKEPNRESDSKDKKIKIA
ncbi:Hsp20/alpha crystallin family protein [Rickettsiales bacterium]|nr:Hsp20/alpha crystallin family protein [Rickettsiales bacterium]